MTSSITSPPLSIDDDRQLTNRLLFGAAVSVTVTGLIGGILIPLTAPLPLWGIYFATVGAVLAVCGAVFWLRQRGSFTAAGWMLVAITWAGITVTSLTSGGVYASAYVGYVAV